MFDQFLCSSFSAALVLAIGGLLLLHGSFAFSSESTLESEALSDFNPFFESNLPINEEIQLLKKPRGCCIASRKNFYQVFGKKPLYWFLPLYVPQQYRTCDGINWKLTDYRYSNES
jgi:hypothetical protein